MTAPQCRNNGPASASPLLDEARAVMLRYWGYDSFRSPQDSIIVSVLEGRDTLGLMPTGGGKSLTFQVPALMMEGLTVVVTPLISLMKDQVDTLAAVGVRAVALHSALTRREYRLGMDRCRLGKAKLLYVSPEKLRSETFASDLGMCKVSLIVVDEAHCISQWGYDFRPSYLQIKQLRALFPNAPVLALTASATPEVADDIRIQLEFRSGNATFARSFARNNISWLVRNTSDKEGMLLRILRATRGSAIVYARSRRRTLELANMLQAEGISAAFYHAGIAPELKAERQNKWKAGEVQVMVATNAFGMGIDKPDVRAVVHWDVPPSLEEYYQEAGRAGRDGKESWAVMLCNASDKANLTRRLKEAFPEKDFIRRVYELAMNFLSISVGEGYNTVHQFDFDRFVLTFKLPERPALSAMKILTRAGWIEYIEDTGSRARMMIICPKNDLYSLRLTPVDDKIFQHILRTYTGLFADYVPLDEDSIAYACNCRRDEVTGCLINLGRQHVIHYIPRSEHPTLYLPTSREEPRFVTLPTTVYELHRDKMKARIDGMRRYCDANDECRVGVMLGYFGEKRHDAGGCGKCDYCRAQRRSPDKPVAKPSDKVKETILRMAGAPEGCSLNDLAAAVPVPGMDLPDIVVNLANEGLLKIDGLTVKRV